METSNERGVAVAEPYAAQNEQPEVIAVNDNGRMLLQWFRSLPDDEQARIVRAATIAAARLRH